MQAFSGAESIAMTVGMQKREERHSHRHENERRFFGFMWQVLFTSENVLNPLSVFGACLVVSSIFVLVFSKSWDLQLCLQQQ